MALYIPSRPNVAPWDVVLHDLHSSGQADKEKFAEIQFAGQPLAGYIICGWDKDAKLRWWYAGGLYNPWRDFDDRVPQEPWIYTRLRDTFNRIVWLKSLCRATPAERYKYTHKPVAHVGLVYWIHPEASYQPLEKYVRISEGTQLPGSPRQ